jgi:nitroreductase
MLLDMTPDQVLSTTRAVRRRLDLTRPVAREVLEECLRLAQQAHIHEVPVHVIPCVEGRTDGMPGAAQASRWGSIIPAAWSFMLAARARGLGTAWTTFHLRHERKAAELLGIPYDKVMQVALIPVAHTVGTDFKPAARKPLDTMVHWDRW